MDDKYKLFLCSGLFMGVALLATSMSYADESACALSVNNTERELLKAELLDLQTHGEDVKLYNFRNQECEAVKGKSSELEFSAFLPLDETSQGLYNYYRGKGESQLDALQHVIKFLNENNG